MNKSRTIISRFISLIGIAFVCLLTSPISLADVSNPTTDIDTNESGNVTFNITGVSTTYANAISGQGKVFKTGAGELVVSGYNSYTGGTFINEGTLTLLGNLAGDVTVTNEAIFKNQTRNTSIAAVFINNGSFFIGDTSETAIVYFPHFEINSGYIEFDMNAYDEFVPSYDSLDVLNGIFNNGIINLSFNNNDEMAWIDGGKDTGYPIISAANSLTFDLDKIKIYADGQQTDNWKLLQVGNDIFIKAKSGDQPTIEPWWYANKADDLAETEWAIDHNPKLGVQFKEGSNYTATYAGNIPMTEDGQYIIGEGYTLTLTGTISGTGALTKEEAGILILGSTNSYTGKTTISAGTLALTAANAIMSSSEVVNNGAITMGAGQTLKNLSGSGTINNGGYLLTVNNSSNTQYSGIISGNGGLTKTGSGELSLSGDHTYTGVTTVNQGTLTLTKVGEKGTLAAGTIITVDGTLDGTAKLAGHGDIFGWGTNAPAKISLINGGTLLNDSTNSHITMGAVIEMNNGIITAADGAVGSGGVGSYIMDNAIHVIGGQNNAINVNEFSIRHLDGSPYPTDEDAGHFDIAEEAKLTINASMDNYSGATNVPVVKKGKGVLEITKRNGNIKSDFIIKEGTVIGNAPNDGSSAFGYGTLDIKEGALLECREANQFGYGGTVQPNITIRGTLKSHMYTHVHNLKLESGTIEDIDPAQAGQGEGLMFYNREATITSSGTSVIKPKMTTDGTMAINVTDGELTISGNITGSAPITKSGAGKLILPNAKSKTGVVTIQAGEVVAGNANSLGTGALTLTGVDNVAGQLTIGATSTDILDLTVSGLVTVDGGQINFDFTANDFDTLVAQNGFTFTTGKFNLNFAQGTEAAWFENVPDEGYKLVSITGTYTGDEDLSAYLSGRTEAWTLTATTDGIYLGKSEEPSSLYWNPITDDGQNWPIDGTNKIGVKYTEDGVKTASHDENITLDSDGVFIIGDEYAFEQVGPISGDGNLTKTEGGKLTLSGDNTYTGDTIVSGGTLELNKANAIATSANVTNNATIESTGDQKLNNLSGTNKDAEINADNGTLTLNNDANSNTRYDGTINGNASVRKIGVGSLMMTGENAYEGGTAIEEGSIVLLTDDTADGTLGVGPIEVGQNGELVYNVDAGQTKRIENKITGAGAITKTGAGTLQANGTDDMPLQAGVFNVNQGRLDLKGEFEGDLNVGPLNDDGTDAILSPGNSVGEVTVYGDVTIDAGATGLFEFSAYNADPALQLFDKLNIPTDGDSLIFDSDSIVKLSFLNNDAAAWAEEGSEYQLVYDPGFVDGDYSFLLANFGNMFALKGLNGDGLYLVGLGAPDNPGVPEPSTWVLLILGIAGALYMRKKSSAKN